MSDAKKILIVEDEKSLRRALSDAFSTEGFEVIEAENGQIGFERAVENQPDCIILDVIMPVMDGMELLKKLRKDQWGADALVILLTNVDQSDKIADAVEEGVFDYFVKTDWKIDDIVARVKERLGLT